MSTSIGVFDITGTYYACVVERPGKRQLQIHPLQKDQQDVTINTSLSLTYELDTDSPLVSVQWLSKKIASNGKRSKRRSSSANEKSTNSLSYVVCAFKNGTLNIYSPFQKEAVQEISTSVTVNSLTTLDGKIFVSGPTETLEYDVNDSNIKNKMKYPKDLKNVQSIQLTSFNGKEYIIGMGNQIVVQEYPTGNVIGSLSIDGEIENSACINNLLVTSKEGQVRVYTLPELRQTHMIHAKGSVSQLIPANDSTVVAVLATGQAQIFKNLTEKVKVLTLRPNTKEVHFTAAYSNGSDFIICWTDTEPKFHTVDIATPEKSIKIDVKHSAKSSSRKTIKSLEPIMPELIPKEQYNLRDVELAALIGVKSDQTVDLLTLLISNPEEEKTRDTVVQLEGDVAVKVYTALKKRISTDPTESQTLNNWLKWIVISHPTVIQPLNSFKPLKTSIRKSLKQLPELLALQGRLELLQSQLSLRSRVGQTDEDIDEDYVDQSVKDAEESIVYVNGENDEGGDDENGNDAEDEEGANDDQDDAGFGNANGEFNDDN